MCYLLSTRRWGQVLSFGTKLLTELRYDASLVMAGRRVGAVKHVMPPVLSVCTIPLHLLSKLTK